jgi:hypothetical protein
MHEHPVSGVVYPHRAMRCNLEMDPTIHIPQSLEERLKSVAAQSGLNASDYAARLIVRHLPSDEVAPDQTTLNQLSNWDQEDQTDDPQEIKRRETEWEEFRRSMNANSLSGRPIYP